MKWETAKLKNSWSQSVFTIYSPSSLQC